MARALYAEYHGPLFNLQCNGARNSRGWFKDIGVLGTGGVANTTAVRLCIAQCQQCVVMRIYDQGQLGNHLGVETGFSYNRPPRNASDARIDLRDTPSHVTLGGAPAFPAVFDTHCHVHEGNCDGLFNGYSNRTAVGLPVDDEPQSVYALFDGKHYSTGCCFKAFCMGPGWDCSSLFGPQNIMWYL
jgi:hypothetical protein